MEVFASPCKSQVGKYKASSHTLYTERGPTLARTCCWHGLYFGRGGVGASGLVTLHGQLHYRRLQFGRRKQGAASSPDGGGTERGSRGGSVARPNTVTPYSSASLGEAGEQPVTPFFLLSISSNYNLRRHEELCVVPFDLRRDTNYTCSQGPFSALRCVGACGSVL